MIRVIIIKNYIIFLSSSILLELGIDKRTFDKWTERYPEGKIKTDGITYFSYDSIPAPSRAKLPSKEEFIAMQRAEEQKIMYSRHLNNLMDYEANYRSDYLNEINERFPDLDGKYKIYIAKKACYMKCIAYKENIKGYSTSYRHAMMELLGETSEEFNYSIPLMERERLTKRLNEVFSKHRKAIQKSGDALAVLIDFKKVKKHRLGKTSFEQIVWDTIQTFAMDDRQFSATKCLELTKKEFERQGVTHRLPCARLVMNKLKKWCKAYWFVEKRMGKSVAKSMLPRQKMEKVQYINQLWQIDGWTSPFWTEGGKGYNRWVLVRVIDVCSGRILSNTVGKSENTVLTMQALKDAIAVTGCIPEQLVMDKHSATKTHDFKHFEKSASALGCEVVVTINPTDKPEIERQNAALNRILSEYPEWLGEGIAGKTPKRRPEEVYKELSKSKNHISPDETIARLKLACARFNEEKLASNGDISPIRHYENTKSKGIKVNIAQQIQLLTDPKQYTVRHGQIITSRGGQTEQYTFPKDMFERYNNEKVIVQYEEFGSEIFVFGTDGSFIACMFPDGSVSKIKAHRKKSPEAPKQIGIAEGIKTQSFVEMAAIDTFENAALIKPTITNKDAFAEMQQNTYLKKYEHQEGIKAEKTQGFPVHIPGEKSSVLNPKDLEENEAAVIETFNPYKRNNNNIKKEQ